MGSFPRNVALIGFMGVGKTAVGRLLAHQLGFEFVDTDELIESEQQCTVTQIFERHGECKFRALEREMVTRIESWDSKVVSTGGGLGANLDHQAALKRSCLVVCLWASPRTIFERVSSQSNRPLLQHADPLARITELLAERESAYRQAHLLITTEQRSVKEVASLVLQAYRLASPNRAT